MKSILWHDLCHTILLRIISVSRTIKDNGANERVEELLWLKDKLRDEHITEVEVSKLEIKEEEDD